MPRAATSVATSTRARPSRSACSAWLRSFWLCSPDSATALKPRSVRLEWSRRTLSRVAQNSMADLRLVEAQQVDHRMLDVGRRDGHRLIGDVAMAALLADRRDAQRVAAGSAWPARRSAAAWSPRRAGCGAPAGVASRISSRSSRKPMSSISSASSSTATSQLARGRARRARDGRAAARACRRRYGRRASRLRRSFDGSMPPTQVAIRAPALP